MKKALLGLLCVISLAACADLSMQEPLSVTIADVKPIEVGILEQRYALKDRLLNPNDAEIIFDGVVFDLEVNDVAFAKGVSNQNSVIPRFGEAVIDVHRDTNATPGLRERAGYEQLLPYPSFS